MFKPAPCELMLYPAQFKSQPYLSESCIVRPGGSFFLLIFLFEGAKAQSHSAELLTRPSLPRALILPQHLPHLLPLSLSLSLYLSLFWSFAPSVCGYY